MSHLISWIVSLRKKKMMQENKVVVERSFDCGTEQLFNWLTDPSLIAQWFGPEGFTVRDVSNEVVVNGQYQIELQKDSMTAFTIKGEYLEIVRPSLLKFSYRYVELTRPESILSFEISPIAPDKSHMRMVQEFEVAVPDFSTRSVAWSYMFEKLATLL